jgi:hypothetical protein
MMPSLSLEQQKERAGTLIYAIYIYFFLLIFEGALRKWVLPEFSDFILLIRDPLAIYILYAAWKSRVSYLNTYVLIIGVVSLIAFYTAMFLGHGNLFIALYGLRITLIHFPLIFIIGAVLMKEDVDRVARWMIILCIPMLILIIIQFYSPQTAWINKGVGDSLGGGGFSGALGYFRPPGTFSFTNGLVLFFTLCSSFIFWSFTHDVKLPVWVIYTALVCLFLSIPFSISRTLLFGILITVFFYLLSSFKYWLTFLYVIVAMILMITFINIIGNFEFLETGIEVFKERFNSANESEGGLEEVILNRYLGGLGRALASAEDYPFWGLGLGQGTNAGSQLSTGRINFIISEGEWGRILGEIGPLLGLVFILTRVILGMNMLFKSYRHFVQGNMLPWLMIGNLLFYISQGQWAQPTSLGFSVFFSGLLLASMKEQND